MNEIRPIAFALWEQGTIDAVEGFSVIAGMNKELLVDEIGNAVAVRPFPEVTA